MEAHCSKALLKLSSQLLVSICSFSLLKMNGWSNIYGKPPKSRAREKERKEGGGREGRMEEGGREGRRRKNSGSEKKQ